MSSDDDIQDDSSDGDQKPSPAKAKTKNDAIAIRKRALNHDIGGFFAASQKFRKVSDGSKSTAVAADSRPWTDKYRPANLEELAVHKKKVADVRGWLERALSGRGYQCLLVLKGAAGTGKTSTVSLLADAVGFGVVEWRNPESGPFATRDYVSVAAQFAEFVHKTRKYGALSIAPVQGARGDANASNSHHGEEPNQQISLVEEFPNIFTRSSEAGNSFRSTILEFLSAHAPSQQGVFQRSRPAATSNPLILVISESAVSSSTASADSFTAHRLLGPEILNHPATTVIEFNAVAPTIITKALNLVVQKHHRTAGERYAPSPQVMQKLAEIGDIRNATSTLEFYCKQAEDLSGRLSLAKKPKGRTKAKAAATAPTSTDPNVAIITHRDSTLTLFHAVGKVVYNKRLALETPDPPPPPHLAASARPLASENDPSTLLATAGTDTSTFIASLHENYLLSCYDPLQDDTTTLATTDAAIDALSTADLLSPRNAPAAATHESLTQDDLAAHAAIRGLAFALPHPVKRRAPPPSSTTPTPRDPNTMLYPASLRLWRPREELRAQLDHLVLQHFRGRLAVPPKAGAAAAPPKPAATKHLPPPPQTQPRPPPPPPSAPKPASKPGNRILWARPKPLRTAAAAPSLAATTPDDEAVDAPIVALGSGASAAREMLLERGPYLALVLRAAGGRGPAVVGAGQVLAEVERVTRFGGVVAGGGDEEEEEEEEEGGERAGAGGGLAAKGREVAVLREADGVEKLVLSDDDIED